MSTIKLPAASGGGSISIKGPSSSGSDVDLLDTSGNLNLEDNKKLVVGTGDDLQIFHETDNNTSRINSTTGTIELRHTVSSADEAMAKFVPNGAVELFHNGTKKLETKSYGVKVEGDLWLDDDKIIKVGSGGDLQIKHDGTHSYISNTTASGNLFVDMPESAKFECQHDGEASFAGYADNRFEAMFDGSRKFYTSSGGITVAGSVNTEDLNLSNLNSATPNEVDNTKGSWSMQEGANDLFLINRTNGKKYKFNLTEVT